MSTFCFYSITVIVVLFEYGLDVTRANISPNAAHSQNSTLPRLAPLSNVGIFEGGSVDLMPVSPVKSSSANLHSTTSKPPGTVKPLLAAVKPSSTAVKPSPTLFKPSLAPVKISSTTVKPLLPSSTPANSSLTQVEHSTPISISSTSAKPQSSTAPTSSTQPTPRTTEVRKIHGRKGVNLTEYLEANLTAPTINTTRRPKKPTFTRFTGESEDDSDSFIESSTTGKDYVFPIVLCILGFPCMIYIIMFIYRRGTEFTERQQYHRMYLIDGMYNSR